MNKQLTLGSLFSGSGGFEYAALLQGIRPVWASEISPFAIRVTTKRLPQVKHLGDIRHIHGGEIEPVSIISFGSPCTNVSRAGRREGIDGAQSSLFFEAIRVIREMREATKNEQPRFLIFENVEGIYNSNGCKDFQRVLEEICQLKDPSLSVPEPPKGRWLHAGEIVGDAGSPCRSFSVAYRTLDSQFWGVAQRRRRCYLVADFEAGRAGSILFESEGVSGYPPSGGNTGEDATGCVAAGVGTAGGRSSAYYCEPGAASRLGGHVWEELAGTLRADMGDNLPAVVYDARGNGDGAIVNTITGDHENRVTDYTALAVEPAAAAFMGGQGAKAGSIAYSEEVAPTIRSQAGGNSVPMVMSAYGIGSYNSRGMISDNPAAGIYEAETARTLDANGGTPACQQGGIAVVTYAAHPGGFGTVSREVANTLQARDWKDQQFINDAQYAVRRLMPEECAELQGFPPDWCSGLETPEPTEADIDWWQDVFETWRRAASPDARPKSRKQIAKWLRDPYSEAAEFSLWGNGISLPCARFVMAGIAWAVENISCNVRAFEGLIDY